MTLVAALKPLTDAKTGDLQFDACAISGWAISGVVESPDGEWVLANGAQISSSGKFAALYAFLNTHGYSTTGVLPNFTEGRQPVARGASVLTTRGATRGSSTVPLNAGHLPGHTHTYNDSQVGGSWVNNWATANNDVAESGGDQARNFNSAGGSVAHDNMPPYQVVEGMWVKL